MLQLFNFPFPAMASNCAVKLYASTEVEAVAIAQSAIFEVERIERRYSRYRSDNILFDINSAAKRAGKIRVDDETAKLIDYAYNCYQRSDGLFDITSGILRKVWDFKSGKLPDRKTVDDLLPLIGLSKISWARHISPFLSLAWNWTLGELGRNMRRTKRRHPASP